jgi:hypothetical protein
LSYYRVGGKDHGQSDYGPDQDILALLYFLDISGRGHPDKAAVNEYGQG